METKARLHTKNNTADQNVQSNIFAIHEKVRKGLERCYKLRQQNYVWKKFPGHLVNNER